MHYLTIWIYEINVLASNLAALDLVAAGNTFETRLAVMLGLAGLANATLISGVMMVLIARAVIIVLPLSTIVSATVPLSATVARVSALAMAVVPSFVTVTISTAPFVTMSIPIGVVAIMLRAAVVRGGRPMVVAMIATNRLPKHGAPWPLNRLIPNIGHHTSALKLNHSLAGWLLRARCRVVAPGGKDPLAHTHGRRAHP